MRPDARHLHRSPIMRRDGRQPDDMRPLSFTRDFTEFAAGSVLVAMGRTKVLCTASVASEVPRWMRAMGEVQITLDCDVVQADGGTRTASICGAYVALHDACHRLAADGLIKSM